MPFFNFVSSNRSQIMMLNYNLFFQKKLKFETFQFYICFLELKSNQNRYTMAIMKKKVIEKNFRFIGLFFKSSISPRELSLALNHSKFSFYARI